MKVLGWLLIVVSLGGAIGAVRQGATGTTLIIELVLAGLAAALGVYLVLVRREPPGSV